MKTPGNHSTGSIEFEDQFSRRLHERLLSQDIDGQYAAFFQRATHQLFENDVNCIPASFSFGVDRILALEIYTGSDRNKINNILLGLANSLGKADSLQVRQVAKNVERAMNKIASEKNSQSFHTISDLVVPVGEDLIESYTVEIRSIGPFFIKIYFWMTPSATLNNEVDIIARNQCNTKVKLMPRTFQRILKTMPPSLSVEKGNSQKRDAIAKLDSRLQNQVNSIVARDAPGILAASYGGVPLVVVYGFRPASSSYKTNTSTFDTDSSEFFRLMATAGVENYEPYEDQKADEVFMEQKRKGKKLSIFGKYIISSAHATASLQEILWMSALKEILRFQSSQLDELENQIIDRTIKKSRVSLASQRLQLYQHSSIYEILISAYNQEKNREQLLSKGEGHKTRSNLFWAPFPGKKLEYFSYSHENIDWLTVQIGRQTKRLKSSYQIAKDEFNDHAILTLQILAILLAFLAIIIPLIEIGLQMSSGLKNPGTPSAGPKVSPKAKVLPPSGVQNTKPPAKKRGGNRAGSDSGHQSTNHLRRGMH